MNYDMMADWTSYKGLHFYKNVSFALSDDLASASLDFTQRRSDNGDEFSYTIRAQRIETSNRYTGSFTCHYNDEMGKARFSLVNLDEDTKLIWGSLWDENDIKYRWWIELTADD